MINRIVHSFVRLSICTGLIFTSCTDDTSKAPSQQLTKIQKEQSAKNVVTNSYPTSEHSFRRPVSPKGGNDCYYLTTSDSSAILFDNCNFTTIEKALRELNKKKIVFKIERKKNTNPDLNVDSLITITFDGGECIYHLSKRIGATLLKSAVFDNLKINLFPNIELNAPRKRVLDALRTSYFSSEKIPATIDCLKISTLSEFQGLTFEFNKGVFAKCTYYCNVSF